MPRGYGINWFYKARPTPLKTISTVFPHLKPMIQRVQQDVLGWAPPTMDNQRSGTRYARIPLKGVYLTQYYSEHESLDVVGRKVGRPRIVVASRRVGRVWYIYQLVLYLILCLLCSLSAAHKGMEKRSGRTTSRKVSKAAAAWQGSTQKRHQNQGRQEEIILV